MVPCDDPNAVSPPGSFLYTSCECKSSYFGDDGGTCKLCPFNNWCFGGRKYPCHQNSAAVAGASNQSQVCI
jgi:hypothetical protein